jgi:GxxExxY protein
VPGMPFTTHAALNDLAAKIIAGAISVHRALGPGLLETAYLACLAYELRALGLNVDVQRAIPLVYRGVTLDCAYGEISWSKTRCSSR